jgi:hypothetical protein
MKAAALQALHHVRATLAYQLTPEAVDRLLEPIQKALDGSGNILEHVSLAIPYIDGHNARVGRCLEICNDILEPGTDRLEFELVETIRSLRL